MRGFIALVVAGCANGPSHTYTVGVDSLETGNVHVSFAITRAFDPTPPTDYVGIAPPQDATGDCPVLDDDVTVTVGGTALVVDRGSYYDGCSDGGWVCDPGQAGCQLPVASGASPASQPATIEVVVSDRHGEARLTVVAPYVQRTIATPATLVPGTTAKLGWVPATDTFSPRTEIFCRFADPNEPTGLHDVVMASMTPDPSTVPIAYHDGVLSFPVPSSVTYHGALTCQSFFNVSGQITECTGIASCGGIGPLPDTTFEVTI